MYVDLFNACQVLVYYFLLQGAQWTEDHTVLLIIHENNYIYFRLVGVTHFSFISEH